MELTYRKNNLHLEDNKLSGSTFTVKDFIKSKLGGKWNGDLKVWTVDVNEVNYWISKGVIAVVEETAPVAHANHNGLCPKCHTYCDGDCTAN